MLSQLLDEKAAANEAQYSDEVNEAYAQGIETVRATGIEKSAKQVGDAAIDAELSGGVGARIETGTPPSQSPVPHRSMA